MQIQGDYHPHSGHGYEPPHTHYITKCLHEEEHTRNQTGAAGIKSRAISSPAGRALPDMEASAGAVGQKAAGRGLSEVSGSPWERKKRTGRVRKASTLRGTEGKRIPKRPLPESARYRQRLDN